MIIARLLCTAVLVASCAFAQEKTMNATEAASFAKLAMAGIDREYPNKPSHVFTGPVDLKTPSQLHPVFFGNYDWHSSVHGHWMLIRLLKSFPDAPFAAEVRASLNKRLTKEGLQAEADYFEASKENRSFERMYGWAWTLRLAMELKSWDDPDAKRWSESFAPLEKEIVTLTKAYLPKLEYPVRCGFHPESSFALSQTLDYARAVKDADLEKLVIAKARQFYGKDRNYPSSYEPSGNDFFSPGLNVADLMRRVLSSADFSTWLDAYLPGLAKGEAGNLLTPVKVSDVTDPQLVHLAGLDLNRAWDMRGIASVLPESDPRHDLLLKSADAHFAAGLSYVDSGHYEGEHWLASFAVYAMTVK
ncbi:MAG: hypothetical protein JWO82_410 [Akkermansiaceae bacterium]|nr:hypothetical protein [Akkermansiaceae bacterium]